MPYSSNRSEKVIFPAVYFLLTAVPLKTVSNQNYFNSTVSGSHNSRNSALYKE
jgi:hypothetical protein